MGVFQGAAGPGGKLCFQWKLLLTAHLLPTSFCKVHLDYVQEQTKKIGGGAVRPRHPTLLDDPPSVERPPQSMLPELLIARALPDPAPEVPECELSQQMKPDPQSAVTAAVETPEKKDRTSKLSLDSKDEQGGPICATLTDRTDNSIKEHIGQTLRMRLGTTKKMISGQELYDAVVALGLTRYSENDVNAVVNKLAAFVRLRFEPVDKKNVAIQHSGTFSRMMALPGLGHQTTLSVETLDDRSKAIWEWPQDGGQTMADFLRGNASEGTPAAQHNLVPFQALAMAFAMDGDGKRIFGNSAELFRAIREILLAGDTNRLVAELTFVRINDLAAPTQPTDPVLYLEPFVAMLVVSNAFILGLQTDEEWEDWDGWQWIEVVFTLVFCVEILVRIRLVGLKYYFCGTESTWNYFDIFLVFAGLIDILLTSVVAESEAAATQLLRACRLVRLTRMFRVFRFKFIKDRCGNFPSRPWADKLA